MKKNILKIILLFSLVILSSILYLSTIGITTDKLNRQISNQVKKVHENLEIDLKKVKIILKPFALNLDIKTVGANLKFDDRTLELEIIKSTISLRSFINEKFSLTDLRVSTKSLEINDLISFIRLFKNNSKFFIAEKLINKGFIILNLDIQFDENGVIKDDFKINGLIKDGNINFLDKYNFSQIDLKFKYEKDELKLNDILISQNKKKIIFPEIKIKKEKEIFLVNGQLKNKKIKFNKKEINQYINLDIPDFKIREIVFSSESNFGFNFDKRFKMENFNFVSKIDMKNLILNTNNRLFQIFPEFEEEIRFEDHKINLDYKNKKLAIEGGGNIFIQENQDKIKYKFIKTQKNLFFDTLLNINQNKIKFDILNYENKKNTDLKFIIKGNKTYNKNIFLNEVSLKEKNNNFIILNLLLENNKIVKLDEINLNFEDQELIKNNINILRKKNNYILKGKNLNSNEIIKNLSKGLENKKNIFKKDFKLNLNLQKMYLDKKNFLKNLEGYLFFRNGKIVDAKLKAFFSKKKEIKFTIKTVNDEKITTLFSSKAKPLVSRYKFIKGFEEGTLDFYSSNKNGISNSILKIYDFRLKELPTLTKILTLASLQGIADILSGEGIRFNDFEMNFTNKNKVMTINEIYAIGPAISVLLSGYVEKDNLISLRGTLVPATTLNKTIGSIPFLGDILVGKKVGEGVFGVSFKIKGPKDKLETSVNPIKTLTPRFITRTLEKIKQN